MKLNKNVASRGLLVCLFMIACFLSTSAVWAKAPKTKKAKPEVVEEETQEINRDLDAHPFFIRYCIGLGLVTLSDVSKAIETWNKQNYSGNYNEVYYRSEHLLLESGYAWNAYSAASVEWGVIGGSKFLEFRWGFDQPVTINTIEYNRFENHMEVGTWYIGPNYYQFFPDQTGRWFIGGGPRYFYNAFVKYQISWLIPPDVFGDGIWTGNNCFHGTGWGGSLYLGRQFPLGSVVGLCGLVEFRYANIPKVTGESPDMPGVISTIAVAPDGSMGIVPESAIGIGGLRYMNVDLTGVEIRAGIEFYI
jgi:hypothetical protein